MIERTEAETCKAAIEALLEKHHCMIEPGVVQWSGGRSQMVWHVVPLEAGRTSDENQTA